jgi:hypothetical protein
LHWSPFLPFLELLFSPIRGISKFHKHDYKSVCVHAMSKLNSNCDWIASLLAIHSLVSTQTQVMDIKSCILINFLVCISYSHRLNCAYHWYAEVLTPMWLYLEPGSLGK